MPEEIEVETKELQEKIDEIHEEERKEARENSWIRWISLSTAVLAVIAAIAAFQAGALSNHSLSKMSEAGITQAQASDAWAYYQAKGIKGLIANQSADTLAGNPAQAQAAARWKQESDRYKKEQDEIQAKAKEFETKRDEDIHEANELMEHHHIFAFSVTFTQVAIALSAIAALTKQKYMWYGSMVIGIVGIVCFFYGFAPQAAPKESPEKSASQSTSTSSEKASHAAAPKSE